MKLSSQNSKKSEDRFITFVELEESESAPDKKLHGFVITPLKGKVDREMGALLFGWKGGQAKAAFLKNAGPVTNRAVSTGVLPRKRTCLFSAWQLSPPRSLLRIS